MSLPPAAANQLEVDRLRRALARAQSQLQARDKILETISRDLEAACDAFQDVYESAAVAFVTLNTQGIVKQANAVARQMLSGGGPAPINRLFSTFVHPADQKYFSRAMRKVTTTHRTHAFELRLVDGEQHEMHMHVAATPAYDADGVLSHWHLSLSDISELRLREAKLQQVHAQMEIAARAAKLGVWNYDLEHGTAIWNRGLYRLLGLKPRQGLEDGQRFFDFIHPDERTGVLANLQMLMNKQGDELNEEFRIVRADGEIRWLAARGRIFRDANGTPRHVAGISFDISARKQREQKVHLAQLQLTRQLSEAERANEELSQYAYAVSHDLKGPLRAIRNYADFLYEDLAGALTGDQKKYLEGMKKAVHQGGELIEDLLRLSHIDRMALEWEPADVPGIVNEIRSLLGPVDHMVIEVEAAWPAFHTDHMVLKQILLNLIANGVKFNRRTPRRIAVGWQPAPGDGIEICVRDNGIGIAPQYTEQIFRIFQRLHTQREYEGTGIGLAIVRKAAYRLGGSVRLESEPEKGSTFYVRLPREKPEAPVPAS
jgi:PAS domain S-box-containing protein